MGVCINHPRRKTSYRCMKYELYLCQDCLHCCEPEIYCRHRTACAIHFMLKNSDLEAEPTTPVRHRRTFAASAPDDEPAA